ncbi:MAG: N-acetyl-gamma-glutamyl-phosphate reductase [Clostridia bacterium]|nr:N-acetyl-gamma-glutamyl-phosphate reductase [Clostridia bacterium]
MYKVFIDGSAGTTGLKIVERLSEEKDISLLVLPEEKRKDTLARREALNEADVAFLCLPDEAAIEAVSLVENEKVAIIDTSTAHRTNPSWTYGFAELAGQREKIRSSKRIANPGCHASGFIALVKPLVDAGLIGKEECLSCFSLTGYTGGGKKMIAEYEAKDTPLLYDAPRQYGLSQHHKHLPEMARLCSLEREPLFCPIVAAFPRGMEVTVPLFSHQVKGSIEDIKAVYAAYYQEGVVRFKDAADEGGFLSACKTAGLDSMEISVYGNGERMLLVSRFDNLGKGASGAAIQNMNIYLGREETAGLTL